MKKSSLASKKVSTTEKVIVCIVVFCSLLNLFPLYWLISNTFKYNDQVFRMPPDWFPRQLVLDNYYKIFATTKAPRWLINSFFISSLGTVLIVLTSALAAYSFSKLEFKGSRFLFAFFVGTLMIPKECYTVPLFIEMRDLKMFNTYSSMILPNVALPIGTFMLKSFFDSIPNEVRESAKIDGASELRIFASIIIPMAKAGIGALFILRFVAVWNDYLWQLLMAKSDEMKTIMVGIASLMEDSNPDYARKLTGSAVSAIPMIIVFIAFQKYFTRGIALGAVKE